MQLDKYLEQAQLLDPHLSGIITPLSGLLRQFAADPRSAITDVQNVSRILWAVATTR